MHLEGLKVVVVHLLLVLGHPLFIEVLLVLLLELLVQLTLVVILALSLLLFAIDEELVVLLEVFESLFSQVLLALLCLLVLLFVLLHLLDVRVVHLVHVLIGIETNRIRWSGVMSAASAVRSVSAGTAVRCCRSGVPAGGTSAAADSAPVGRTCLACSSGLDSPLGRSSCSSALVATLAARSGTSAVGGSPGLSGTLIGSAVSSGRRLVGLGPSCSAGNLSCPSAICAPLPSSGRWCATSFCLSAALIPLLPELSSCGRPVTPSNHVPGRSVSDSSSIVSGRRVLCLATPCTSSATPRSSCPSLLTHAAGFFTFV